MGRMDDTIRDDQFPGTKVTLRAAALAEAVGLVVRIGVAGVWSFGKPD